jgi:SAM-dependent methyltransferase
MVHIGSLYKSFYKRIKENLWRTMGDRFYRERSIFLVDLLNKTEKELKIPTRYNSSEHCLLDIGCGKGNLTEKISETHNLKAIGVDSGKMFVFNARTSFLIADACSLPFTLKSFNLVLAFSLVEHIHEDCRQEFYEEVRKVLIDDGIFVMQLPNRYFPIEQHSFLPLVGYLPSRLHSAFYHDYVNVPSKDETVGELIKRGFKIVGVVGYGVPFSSLFRKNMLSKIFPFGFLIVAKKMI